MLQRTPVLVSLLLILLTGATLADDAVRLKRVAADGSARLELDPDLGKTWRDVNVGRLVVRTVDRQRRFADALDPSAGHVDIDVPADECALVLADVGPPARRLSADAWRRVDRMSKVLICPGDESPTRACDARRKAGALATSKVGGPLEVRALLNPATLRPGRDLAVRIYRDGEAVPGAIVRALGPGGRALETKADRAGIAVVPIASAGDWRIRYRAYGDHGPEASLGFEVSSLACARPTSTNTGAPESKHGPLAGVWRELGPAPLDDTAFAGRIAAVATSDRIPGGYFAGAASGGVWRSFSGGAWWRPLLDDAPMLSIGALAIDPSDERVLYAGGGEGHYAYHSLYGLGLFKSTDRGRHWRRLAESTFAGRTFSRLAVDPTDGNVVWAAVARAGGNIDAIEGAKEHPDRLGPVGVMRSTDGGVTWSPAPLPAVPATDIDLVPRDPNLVFATLGDPYGDVSNGVWRSTDGGASFQVVLSLGAFLGRSTLAIAPSNPDRMYLLTANRVFPFNFGGFLPFGGGTFAVFRSDDGGSTWSQFQPGNFQGSQGQYVSAVTVDPEDPDTVFVGGINLLRSTDAGATFVDVTPPHVDIQDLAYDAAGRLLAATDGGLFRSNDGGDSWEARNRNLGTMQMYAGLSLDPSQRRVVLGGTQDNGSVLRDTQGDWRMVAGGDGGYTAISSADPDLLFVEFQGVGNLFRSTDGGDSFNLSNEGIDVFADWSAFQAPFLFDPTDPERMLYATQRMYESTDAGLSWTPISDDLTDFGLDGFAAIRSVTVAPSNGDVVYATTNNQRLLVSSDGGVTWALALEDLAGWPRVMRQVAIDPGDADFAIAADGRFGGDRVRATADRGANWTAIGGDLPDRPVNTVAIHRGAHGRVLFAGTDEGVYESRDDGLHWRRFGRRLPRAPVVDLVVDPARGRLVAGTLGRGVWSTRLR